MTKTYAKPQLTRVACLERITAGGTKPKGSDRRLKTAIRRLGTTVFGLPLYLFRYLDGDGTFVGVMSDEVRKVMPDAVLTDADGYDRVDYAMLGIRMVRVA